MLTCLIFTVPDRSWITESVKKYLGGKKKNMYRKDSEGWLKHADFMVLDMICLQLAFILAYALRGKGMNLYGDILYRNMAIFLGLADLVVIFTAGTMKSVLKEVIIKNS